MWYYNILWYEPLMKIAASILYPSPSHSAAGCNPFAVSLIGDYFPMEVRASAISIYYFGIYIGYSLAFAIGNGIEKVLSWRWVGGILPVTAFH